MQGKCGQHDVCMNSLTLGSRSQRICFPSSTSLILAKLGPISQVRLNGTPVDEKTTKARQKSNDLIVQARAMEIIGKVTSSGMIYFWMVAFGVIALLYLLQAIDTADADDAIPQGGRPPIGLLEDFYYPPQPHLSYPGCKLTKGFEIPGRGFSYLYDYNMLAALAYETLNVTEYILEKWFGSEQPMIDETDLVAQWRRDTGNDGSGVSFKLFSIPSQPGMGVVSIRGTQTSVDRLLNAQLYMSSIMTQLVRALLPFGWIWRDIYDDLIATVAWVGSVQLKESAYYRITTAFVNDLLKNDYTYNDKSFNLLRVTGVSLGGGIALITGAQTEANAVAIAGVNPTLGRLTFDPPIEKEALNNKIFNTVPDRDYISRIGDPPRNTQHIECRTPRSNVGGCHSFWRIFCELLYSCGSQPRPVLCVCQETYGFPEPISNGTRTFAQACQEEEEIVKQLG